MYQALLSLEKDFFRYDHISDKNWLNSVLHDEFQECGKSGRIFRKEETVEALLSCNSNREISIYNFQCCEIKPNCWMVHYITKTDEDELIYRTSIWVKENQLKLYFHQATKLSSKTELIEC